MRLAMKPVGEPDAGDRHVRFDERGWETARCHMAQATAPIMGFPSLRSYVLATSRKKHLFNRVL